jgi:hypothetical protein
MILELREFLSGILIGIPCVRMIQVNKQKMQLASQQAAAFLF